MRNTIQFCNHHRRNFVLTQPNSIDSEELRWHMLKLYPWLDRCNQRAIPIWVGIHEFVVPVRLISGSIQSVTDLMLAQDFPSCKSEFWTARSDWVRLPCRSILEFHSGRCDRRRHNWWGCAYRVHHRNGRLPPDATQEEQKDYGNIRRWVFFSAQGRAVCIPVPAHSPRCQLSVQSEDVRRRQPCRPTATFRHSAPSAPNL